MPALTATPAWLLAIPCLACVAGQARAGPGANSALADPIDTSLGSQPERVTVQGHRPRVFMAPAPDPRLSEPGRPTGFGSGIRLEGGPVHDAVSDGLSVGLAIPIVGIEGLDFIASLATTRDSLSPSGTTGAAAAVAGLRLKF